MKYHIQVPFQSHISHGGVTRFLVFAKGDCYFELVDSAVVLETDAYGDLRQALPIAQSGMSHEAMKALWKEFKWQMSNRKLTGAL